MKKSKSPEARKKEIMDVAETLFITKGYAKTTINNILSEIDKILKVDIKEEEIMISPSTNQNVFDEDKIEQHLPKEDMFKNAKRVKGDYIIVPKVIE